MTWNIWRRFGPKWQERQSVLVETLRAVDPDVVALQEVWGTDETTQAHEFAAILGLHEGFAEPSYPAVPDPPHVSDHDSVTLGLGVLSRWPITSMHACAGRRKLRDAGADFAGYSRHDPPPCANCHG